MTVTDGSAGAREIALMTALAKLRQRLANAAEAVGRKPADIELLAVTKFFPASDVAILSRLGCRAFGESREQEAARKVADVVALLPDAAGRPITWHMIGQIQRNKAKSIVGWADTVHSVSSARVITALDRAAAAAVAGGTRRAPLGVYLQLSLDGATDRLATEHGRVMERHPEATGLSAGMSGDLEIAVKHGSTCVRVGTALLGQRPLTSP